ncbi:MAG TPA: acetyl-CoA C-acetyltransferase [Gemmataceae bacterium]|nr:acetyl-CoA C-acetyltransferase [Gemmataceae bacterium]
MAAEVFILSGVRSPIGAMSGALADVPAPELGAIGIKEAVKRAGVKPEAVNEVIMGNVVAAGLGQNPARQAAIKAGLPVSVGATTVNKVCGSGLKSVMFGAQAIRLGEANVIVAGGMENMTRAPYLLPKARQGYRMGHAELLDAMIQDGLWDIYGQRHMGTYGDRCADRCGLTRKDQDDFAVRSFTRARKAVAEGLFKDEIVPVPVTVKKQTILVAEDEGPTKFDEAKLRALKPAFSEGGTVTAGNASSINDGAAALVLASGTFCDRGVLKPVARIVGASTFSREPEWFTLAPIGALRKLLDQVNWSVATTDLFEINEAFAAVTLAAERDLNIPPEKVNVYGGAVALGHPIGASGARILVTLLTGLKRTGGKRGIACLCIGGGEAVALAVERV